MTILKIKEKEISDIDRDLTLKQRAFLKRYLECGNGTKAAFEVYDCKDYASASEIASQNLRKLKNPIRAFMESKGLSLGYLCGVLAGGLTAKKIFSSHTEPDKEVDDWQTRHKYLETAGKWLGISEESQFMQQININNERPIPILDNLVIVTGAQPKESLINEPPQENEPLQKINVEELTDEQINQVLAEIQSRRTLQDADKREGKAKDKKAETKE